ncbi:probable G-protein coupled receptor 160 [Falco biarmicus]|uniref:probable G-protein coupled receptor 160 n=1 Tax=Falco biarmicus TaxID=345155 RepID=UPI0024BC268E|nr:probable G-protein coupled receptor 160 [Falco biarmicus]XP_056215065.1 probable G-protein coupled receptor 160 [Falco biarmicus]XP_056215066.1 probable G-protein coupled receptor 160 [Falco biarmicus]XP_056215067.1 probable G-protein coupled receptor 160 [Falco biarmicus]XP_056215068.1 probable G-protein coupled receptor 160 [Falco biarmicus]XP_056215069.1 probable G-protein coupled receptor 160 [Falco biarmicus]XP_056215070.1 probable G-protein coupled receptor 160 [Falco biarmicus]
MAAILCENCSGQYHYTQVNQSFEISCMLLLIVLGKVFLDFFMLQVKQKNVKTSFLGYFCISLALLDFVLLMSISFIFCFEDFALWGVRFTKYHICLFTQIISLTYSILHYPVYLVAGLDYYMTVAQTSEFPKRGQRLLYVFAVVVIWISGFFCILKVPAIYEELEIQNRFSPYQCPLYTSMQSYSVSCATVLLIAVALLACWKQVVTMLLSVRVVSFAGQPVLMFPCVSNNNGTCSKWQLLTRLLICFLGTWAPLVLLQIIILFLGARIPAYMEMNVPWLYFINSFLIAVAYWCRCHDVELTEEMWSTDPFVSWKFCFMPFNNENTEPADRPGTVIVIC